MGKDVWLVSKIVGVNQQTGRKSINAKGEYEWPVHASFFIQSDFRTTDPEAEGG